MVTGELNEIVADVHGRYGDDVAELEAMSIEITTAGEKAIKAAREQIEKMENAYRAKASELLGAIAADLEAATPDV